MNKLARLDLRHVWHPFTQMRDWLKHEPIVIVQGRGAWVRDVRGRRYLDANASIWTNLHGHRHPRINRAIRRQLGKIAHCSALGLANEPASVLAAKLVQAAERGARTADRLRLGGDAPEPGAEARLRGDTPGAPNPRLSKVFFSDDGSTALEVALKLAYEHARRTGRSRTPRFLSLAGAYHGDTVGAVSLGHIDLFHRAYAGLLFGADQVMAPYCYRCPFNRAKPERADARDYRRCHWECVDQVQRAFERRARRGHAYAAFVVEPRIQGAAGMIPQPAGWLRRVTDIARGFGARIIADEVMTGFGRTGQGAVEVRAPGSESRGPAGERPQAKDRVRRSASPDGGANSTLDPRHSSLLFACHQEGVQPDFLCVAKGLTGGYLPMAATLTTPAVFDAFLGEYDEFKTFFHGHSFTANPLGAAAALASLDLLESRASQRARRNLESALREELASLRTLPNVGDVRQVGLIAGVELVRDWRTREPFELRDRAGIRVCEAMAERGVLTRPVGNVVVLMPPYCMTPTQLKQVVGALRRSCRAVFGGG
jgi:adenosylmethionine---8-amino-7-oxononanoate aminotransferase